MRASSGSVTHQDYQKSSEIGWNGKVQNLRGVPELFVDYLIEDYIIDTYTKENGVPVIKSDEHDYNI